MLQIMSLGIGAICAAWAGWLLVGNPAAAVAVYLAICLAGLTIKRAD